MSDTRLEGRPAEWATAVFRATLTARAEAFEEAAAWCEGDYADGAVHHFRNLAHAARTALHRRPAATGDER
jgi:hypothetical protein